MVKDSTDMFADVDDFPASDKKITFLVSILDNPELIRS